MFSLIEYMPMWLRSSHEAAGNSGAYPLNGAVRVWVEGDYRADAELLDEEWSSCIRSAPQLPEHETAEELPEDAMRGLS